MRLTYPWHNLQYRVREAVALKPEKKPESKTPEKKPAAEAAAAPAAKTESEKPPPAKVPVQTV